MLHSSELALFNATLTGSSVLQIEYLGQFIDASASIPCQKKAELALFQATLTESSEIATYEGKETLAA